MELKTFWVTGGLNRILEIHSGPLPLSNLSTYERFRAPNYSKNWSLLELLVRYIPKKDNPRAKGQNRSE